MADAKNISENIGFLLQDTARLARRQFNRRLQDLGLTQAQWRCLLILSRKPGLRQQQLADVLEMQPISVGRLIDRMEASGWAERRPDPTDRRAFTIYLTDQAEPILSEIKTRAMATRAELFNGLSTEEKEILFGILTRMRANVAAGLGCGEDNDGKK